MSHLSTDHGFEKAHHCTLTLSKNGRKCTYSKMDQFAMRKHLAQVHGIGKAPKKRHHPAVVKASVINPFLGVYFNVSADCKLCGDHFDEYSGYKAHLKRHFDEDPDKEWMYCLECDPGKERRDPMAHICRYHDYDDPYRCMLKMEDGTPCTGSNCTKQGIAWHLWTSHKILLEVELNSKDIQSKKSNTQRVRNMGNELDNVEPCSVDGASDEQGPSERTNDMDVSSASSSDENEHDDYEPVDIL